MSEETVPQQGGTTAAAPPKGLLQQMEELMAALNADLSDLEIKAGFSPRNHRRVTWGDVNLL
ncbi:hypothetical protein OG352_32225 [Streptomyces sp. NBC_01485]|uniref:hypothetical protein n=1 Tax=Streptomyces sp. NBC_01485 TaxID=2903884 RepID=UPI002E36A12F|nr:hypothetical protein [Streptomyces sp. NBC_01485]